MQQFDLSLWLKNKSRKVVTRDGRSVRIICTDARIKGIRNTKCKQIIALVTKEDKTEITLEFYPDGTFYRTEESYFDLFFADEEDDLNEFEKAMQEYYFPELDDFELKRFAKGILDLARKEIQQDIYDNGYRMGYELGKQDALKDLPKWKKITEKEQQYQAYGFLSWDGYYLSVDELKQKLPKEK